MSFIFHIIITPLTTSLGVASPTHCPSLFNATTNAPATYFQWHRRSTRIIYLPVWKLPKNGGGNKIGCICTLDINVYYD